MIALIEILNEALTEIHSVFTDTQRKVLVPRGPTSPVMAEALEPACLALFLPQGGGLCPSVLLVAGSPGTGVIPLYSKPHQPLLPFHAAPASSDASSALSLTFPATKKWGERRLS